MRLYMMVTGDEYELPLIVCDTIKELSMRTNTNANTISTLIHYQCNGRYSDRKFVKVEVDDE